MIQGIRWLPYLSVSCTYNRRSRWDRGGGYLSERAGIWIEDRRWIRSRNKSIPMISLDRIRIQCAGNLPKNQPAQMRRSVLGASATYASNRFRLLSPRDDLFLIIFANCTIFRVTLVECYFEVSILNSRQYILASA